MSKNVLISLVSDQTIPNLELIKEFEDHIDQYLFVHSEQTVNQMEWIVKAAQINQYQSIEVNAFDIGDIEEKLKMHSFPDDQYILNITGGTKVMILVFQEFFKNLGAKIFYVTGQNCEYLKVFPAIGQRKLSLKSRINLQEYLTAYGFEIKTSKPLKSYDQSEKLLSFFLTNNIHDFYLPLEKIRNKRDKILNYSEDPELKQFLNELNFVSDDPGKLSKKETKYLSGEWFEEYVYFKIKEELKLKDDEIGTGYNLIKKGAPNEIDVLFVYNNKLYIIECKTSVIETRTMTDGSKKDFKLLPEVIYKSDALKSKFGLFANTSIFTLEQITNGDGSPVKGYETHFDRADLSKIKIITKKDLSSGKPISELLKIK